ncbi:bZIP transcription factor 11-like [Rhodamnia argentea]|uniref:BZIP transcription factor 11-like n=1 Tax=Rhodamnia argentea TaxID=178133 RepID=A0A8B8PBX9_9MYRT|nr:bZIP transcription factor 11-like [Rhodamnia argentea]
MLAAMPTSFPSGTMPDNPFQSFDTDFAPWDCIDNPFSDLTQFSKPVVISTYASDDSNLDQVNCPSNSSNSCGEKRKGDAAVDERKRRRKISNRESAKRSRMRKQRNLENLRNQVNRLKLENQELSNRLRLVLYHCYQLRRSNDQLRSEQSMLQHKLSNMQQVLLLQLLQQQQQNTPAWPCSSNPIIQTRERTSSLIA